MSARLLVVACMVAMGSLAPARGEPGRDRHDDALDQVQAGFFRTADGLFNWQNANLLTVRVKNTDLGGSNLAIGTRTSGGRRARDEWWTRNQRSPS